MLKSCRKRSRLPFPSPQTWPESIGCVTLQLQQAAAQPKQPKQAAAAGAVVQPWQHAAQQPEKH
jgi:hypothetical protein